MSESLFDAMFRAEYPGIVRDIDFVVGDHDVALELAQEAFIRLYSKWNKVSLYDYPRAWVRTVGVRLGLRHRSRRRQMEDLLRLQGEPGHQEGPSGVDIDVRKAVLALPKTQRAAVVLHYFHDLSTADVAKAIGCKEPTARVHLHQARENLAKSLAAYAPG